MSRQGGPFGPQTRVLHCAETIKGGIATYLRELIRLQAQEFGPEAIAVVIPASQMQELPVPEGVRVTTFPVMRRRSLSALALAIQVARTTRKLNPSVVHVHSSFAGATVRPVLLLMGMSKRVIYCPHGWAFDRKMAPWARKVATVIEKCMSPMCSEIVCISEHERRTAINAGLPAHKLKVVLNGISACPPEPKGLQPEWRSSALRILFVGRFDPQKGVDLFCSALRRMGPEVHAILAGGSVVSGAPGGLVLPENASSIGWVNHEQLEVLLRTADVLVMPSRWEGFGLIATEAMRAGLAVVASRLGGLPEVVADGETGILFNPYDVEELVRVLTDTPHEHWKSMGLAGRARFQKLFTMDRVHQELVQIYKLTASQSQVIACTGGPNCD